MTDSKISFWFVPPEIASLDLPLLESCILGVVFGFTRNGGECWITDQQLADKWHFSRKTINVTIGNLCAKGLLYKEVVREANGTTPRRLTLSRPTLPLSPTVTTPAIPEDGLVTKSYYPSNSELLPLLPTVTTLVTESYTNINNINKDNLSKDNTSELPPSHFSKKTEVENEIQSGIQESLKTESESENDLRRSPDRGLRSP